MEDLRSPQLSVINSPSIPSGYVSLSQGQSPSEIMHLLESQQQQSAQNEVTNENASRRKPRENIKCLNLPSFAPVSATSPLNQKSPMARFMLHKRDESPRDQKFHPDDVLRKTAPPMMAGWTGSTRSPTRVRPPIKSPMKKPHHSALDVNQLSFPSDFVPISKMPARPMPPTIRYKSDDRHLEQMSRKPRSAETEKPSKPHESAPFTFITFTDFFELDSNHQSELPHLHSRTRPSTSSSTKNYRQSLRNQNHSTLSTASSKDDVASFTSNGHFPESRMSHRFSERSDLHRYHDRAFH
eukprot:TRINITY_DN2636_c0_g3_i13.p1 TRINITY_DN2636_c0_g3~~TRINITY_DN2636_c0_g3_i13.p1  ORF type:complete len:297 (+),score=51.75 TRINITY_DN2636_c0_g3_i13:104-994(+)